MLNFRLADALSRLGLHNMLRPMIKTGPGRKSIWRGMRLQPMSLERREWRDRGLQLDSRECRRRSGRLYAK